MTAQLEMQSLGKYDIRQQLDCAHRRGHEEDNETMKNQYVLFKILGPALTLAIFFCGGLKHQLPIVCIEEPKQILIIRTIIVISIEIYIVADY